MHMVMKRTRYALTTVMMDAVSAITTLRRDLRVLPASLTHSHSLSLFLSCISNAPLSVALSLFVSLSVFPSGSDGLGG